MVSISRFIEYPEAIPALAKVEVELLFESQTKVPPLKISVPEDCGVDEALSSSPIVILAPSEEQLTSLIVIGLKNNFCIFPLYVVVALVITIDRKSVV